MTIFVAVLLAASATPLGNLEQSSYDVAMRLAAARRPGDQLLLVTIDDADIQELGSWPWSGATLARGLNALQRAGAAQVVYLDGGNVVPAADSIQWLRRLDGLPADQLGSQARAIVAQANRAMNWQRYLAGAIADADNFIVSLNVAGPTVASDLAALDSHRLFAVAGQRGDMPLLSALDLGSPKSLLARVFGDNHGIWPAPGGLAAFDRALAERAGGVGIFDPGDGRFAPLVLAVEGRVLPSTALLVATRAMNLSINDIAVYPDAEILLGDTPVPVNGTAMLPFYYGAAERFETLSFRDLLEVDLQRVASGKTVLIGSTAAGVATANATPIDDAMPDLFIVANRVAALLNDDLYRIPDWSMQFRFAVLVLLGLLVWFLPRLGWRLGVTLSLVFAVVLINLEILALISQGVWLQAIVPVTALLLAQAYLLARQFGLAWLGGNRHELSETYRKLAMAYQAQGQLDLALECFRKCIPDQPLVENIFNLALDFERKRQYGKAITIYERIKQVMPRFEDIDNRIERVKTLANRVSLPGTSTGTLDSLAVGTSEISKPMLGRYEIQKELGRGAMGIVYLGRDPKINRTVAIKTLALSQEFEGAELEEVKQHFFREAETAGRLSHPNIVTIYDVGEDQDLAYIAMDCLSGEDLQKVARRPNLLPWEEVFKIVIKVAEALDYAHSNHVVHRDIKPANIIYDRSKKLVKVTDFGVAHVMGTHKTKTGTILGSPSYMSPEQVQGSKVDGRADIWSLGVTLYQLLSGVLPFRGQPLATLMYQIANDKHEDISVNMPGLPKCVSAIINKALQKDPLKRYQSGTGMAGALKLCLQKSNG